MTEFVTVAYRSTLPASCMAFENGRRCLAPASKILEDSRGLSTTACDLHVPSTHEPSEAAPRPEAPPEAEAASLSRPDWTTYFLALAATVATRADCTRRQVGAVLVAPDRRVLSTGYNGARAGVPGCLSAGSCPRGRTSTVQVPSRSDYASGEGACVASHAEWNAVVYARPASRHGATMYVTVEPCPQCYALLEACGITDVHWPAGTD